MTPLTRFESRGNCDPALGLFGRAGDVPYLANWILDYRPCQWPAWLARDLGQLVEGRVCKVTTATCSVHFTERFEWHGSKHCFVFFAAYSVGWFLEQTSWISSLTASIGLLLVYGYYHSRTQIRWLLTTCGSDHGTTFQFKLINRIAGDFCHSKPCIWIRLLLISWLQI